MERRRDRRLLKVFGIAPGSLAVICVVVYIVEDRCLDGANSEDAGKW